MLPIPPFRGTSFPTIEEVLERWVGFWEPGRPRAYMDISKNRGTPKWMFYNGKPYEQMDDFGGFPPIFGNTHIVYKWSFTWGI